MFDNPSFELCRRDTELAKEVSRMNRECSEALNFPTLISLITVPWTSQPYQFIKQKGGKQTRICVSSKLQ